MDDQLPRQRNNQADQITELRYGENPHQQCAVYDDPRTTEPNVIDSERVSGEKGMSYLNYVDAAGGLELIKEFREPAAAVIKHANPAGCATAPSLVEAYERALSTDPKSAFGGVVVLNRPCDSATADRIGNSVKHVVVAPGYDDDALDILAERENMRVLDVTASPDTQTIGPDQRSKRHVETPLIGGRLLQNRDLQSLSPEDLDTVTERDPSASQIESMLFGWKVVKHATSNAVVFSDGTETVSAGIGQVSRVDAIKMARMKLDDAAGKSANGAVLASDAFLSHLDNIEVAAEAGIEAVIQPGGCSRDEEIIAAANEHDIAMAFTGQRCFLH